MPISRNHFTTSNGWKFDSNRRWPFLQYISWRETVFLKFLNWKNSEALTVVAGSGEVCCYKGVCPTADRCNACIRGLKDGTLTRKSRHLCNKFWSSRCGEERKSASCHAFGMNKVLSNIPKKDRFDCVKIDQNGNHNYNCRITPNG